MFRHKQAVRREMRQPQSTDVLREALTLEELERVSGGRDLGPHGFFATTPLEAVNAMSGTYGQVMWVVDGVIMNKDELGLI